MTNQEVFDIIVSHLRKQNCKSELNGFCLYRGPRELKCAAGILISDEEYDPMMDSMDGVKIWRELTKEISSLKEKYAPNCDLIEIMQSIHDVYEICEWEKEFKKVALEFDLLMPNEI